MKIRIKKHTISMFLFWVLMALFLFGVAAYADETPVASEQSLESDNNYLGANIQAEMPKDRQKQRMHIHLNVLSLNVQYIRTESISNIKK